MSGKLTLASDQPGIPGSPGTPGSTGPAGAGSAGLWQPADNALVAANLDPAHMPQSVTISAGILYLWRVKMSVDSVLNHVALSPRSPNAAGLANTFVGVYTISGTTATLLGQSNDASTQMQTSSEQKVPLSAATASQAAGTELFVALLVGSGTTMPTLLGVNGRSNVFRTTGARRCMVSGTGQTALPGTVNLSTAGDGGNVAFAGLA